MEKTTASFPFIPHGADYNPEQWPAAVWDEDVRLMREAHVNIATLPVFGWASLQPAEEVFTFEWLDQVVEKLAAGGVRLCLATATASVPAWVDRKYPDVLRVSDRGVRFHHGQRHTFCPNSPNFRRLSADLARRLAERYGHHPSLLVWHISNEYAGNDGNYCYCGLCAEAFRGWLRGRYPSLADLNARWHTQFWGHTYGEWAEIEPPMATGEANLQALSLEYYRFQSESFLACCRAEADAIRAVSPGVPITTNFMGAFKPLDYHAWAKVLDIVSWDSYPYKTAPYSATAFAHALMRGCKGAEGQPFMLMEQTPSQTNWQPQNALKAPGVLRLWSYQAMAHGADAVMYFQWRRSQGGMEKFHGAVVEHAGHAETRVFREVAALGAELAALGARTLGATVPAGVAVLFDWDCWHALEGSAGPTKELKYQEHCSRWFEALNRLSIPADVVSPEADLSKYTVVIAPMLYMVKAGVAERLEQVASRGGTVVATYLSGIADWTDSIYLGGYPGPLRRLLGVWVEEVDALYPGEANSALFTEDAPGGLAGHRFAAEILCERAHPEGAHAEVVATYGANWYAGEPAVTRNRFGEGLAYYVAAVLEPAGFEALLRAVCAERGIAPVLPGLPTGVEAMPRVTPVGEPLLFVLNHNDESATLALPANAAYTDLLDGGKAVERQLALPRYGVAILARAG